MYNIIINNLVGNFYRTHQTLSEAFDHSNYIWRKDSDTTIVRSAELPKRELATGEIAGKRSANILKNGEEISAMIRMNTAEHGRDGKYHAIVSEKIEAWFKNKMNGFQIDNMSIVDEGIKKAFKKNMIQSLHSRDIFCEMKVTDEISANTLMNFGVGREKRYGFGMIVLL